MTDTLPRAIADLCGVLMGETRRTQIKEDQTETKAIDMQQSKDGLWTVTRFGSSVGCISKIGSRPHSGPLYRAINAHNEIKHLYSLQSAKEWILSSYH